MWTISPRARFALFLLVSLLLAHTGCAQFTGLTATSAPGLNVRHQITTDPDLLYPKDREMRLIAGDVINVDVYGVQPGYTQSTRVSLNGFVTLPMLGSISVSGLTPSEAGSAISKRFQDLGVFNNPQVNITVTDAPAHIATFIGEVRGVTPVIGYKRLYDALSGVGGLPASASTVLSITRPGVQDPIVVDMGNDPAHSEAANIPIFAGDTITTGRLGEYFVVGAVGAPGAHPFSGGSPTTVMQAMAISGGPTFAAIRNSTKLIRTVGNQRTVINLQLKDIMSGKAPDPVLQSDDIIMVPSNTFKALLRSGGVTTVLAIALTATTLVRAY